MNIYLEIRLIFVILISVLLISCSKQDIENNNLNNYDVHEIADPLEKVNRENFEKFIRNIKKNKPIINNYKKTPNYFKDRINDFNQNMKEPVIFMSSLLQGKLDKTIITLFRMIINFSFGLLGTIDIASELGLKAVSEDLGQVFAKWGLPQGNYLFSETSGPTTTRDVYGKVLSAPLRPTLGSAIFLPMPYPFIAIESISTPTLASLDYISKQYQVIENLYESSMDPYETFKSLYLSQRQALIDN